MKQIKKITLLSIICLFGFSFNSFSQNFDIDINNTAASGCDWTIDVYGNGGTLLQSISNIGGSGLVNYGCQAGSVDSIVVNDNYGGACVTINFVATLGNIAYTSVTPSCSTSCSTSITCAGGFGSMSCTAPAANYLIEIKP